MKNGSQFQQMDLIAHLNVRLQGGNKVIDIMLQTMIAFDINYMTSSSCDNFD